MSERAPAEPLAADGRRYGRVGDAAWRTILSLLDIARTLREEPAADPRGRVAFARDLEHVAGVAGPLAAAVYLPLVAATARGPLTIAQAGQSLDGKVAAATGLKSLINGCDGLDHLHRLRALVDGVIVGASTVVIDDPQLTTRRVPGANPVRIVIDPRRRLGPGYRIFAEDGAAPTLILCRRDHCPGDAPATTAVVGVPGPGERPLSPRLLLAALHRRGLKSLLIEGGPTTLSLFLAAGEIDRLHIVIAPLIVGGGPSAFVRPAVAGVDDAMRLIASVHRLGGEVLFDGVPQHRPQRA